jgi:Protein of unknown function (DUF2889)
MKARSRFQRSIVLDADAQSVLAVLEDDFHHFRVTLEHSRGVVTGIRHTTIRYPWSLCPTAGNQLQALVGTPLKCELRAALAQGDIRMNCTHLFDLACLAATAVARGIARRRYDMAVEMLNPAQRTATLARDDGFQLAWKIQGSEIADPVPFAGIGLKRGFVDWAADTLALDEAEAAILLRRAVFVSGGLRRDLDEVQNAAEGARTIGGCFVMREGIAERAFRMKGSTRDYSLPGTAPLEDK